MKVPWSDSSYATVMQRLLWNIVGTFRGRQQEKNVISCWPIKWVWVMWWPHVLRWSWIFCAQTWRRQRLSGSFFERAERVWNVFRCFDIVSPRDLNTSGDVIISEPNSHCFDYVYTLYTYYIYKYSIAGLPQGMVSCPVSCKVIVPIHRSRCGPKVTIWRWKKTCRDEGWVQCIIHTKYTVYFRIL